MQAERWWKNPVVPATLLEAHEPGVVPVAHARPSIVINAAAADHATGIMENVLYAGLVPDHYLCAPFSEKLCRDADCKRVGRRRVRVG